MLCKNIQQLEEAKWLIYHGLLCQVEAIMNDFVQLRADTDRNENETMVEG
jgi:hypothetical protein